MTTSKLLKYLTYGLVLQSATLPAFADAGIPTIIAIWPMGWILLIAIIPIEAKIAEKILKIPPWKGLEISGRANFVSTLAGVPITWFLLVISELMLGGGSRRIGHVASTTDWIFRSIIEGPVLVPGSAPEWYIPLALSMMNFPFCLMSVLVEQKATEKFIDNVCTKALLQKWAWFANIASYAFINSLIAIATISTFLLSKQAH
ncbi:hypothetical protein BH11CYA1_BH11CYA1_23370 [soil metagenome]